MDEQEKKKSTTAEDWNPDYFPTSAKPVFRATFFLTLVVALLCVVAYVTSDHPENTEDLAKRSKVEENFLADEQLDEDLEDELDAGLAGTNPQ